MKIKIKNLFAVNESEVVIGDLQSKTVLDLKDVPGSPNMLLTCKTMDGYPFFVNIPRGACLAVSFVKD